MQNTREKNWFEASHAGWQKSHYIVLFGKQIDVLKI